MGDDEVADLSERRYARRVLRAGRKVGRTIYWQVGGEASDSDPLIGVMDTRMLAAGVVDAVNAAWELTEHFEAELRRDPDNGEAQWALSLLRPIWAGGLGPEGAGLDEG